METKRIKITPNEGCVLIDAYGINSVAFLAIIPKNAVVDAVKVNGKYLDDIGCVEGMEEVVTVAYPRTEMNGNHRVVANVRIIGDASRNAFYNAACAYEFTEFEVEYHENAVIEL